MENSYYRVDNFLLSDEWNNEKDYGRISYCFKSRWGITKKQHKEFVDKKVKKLISDNNEDYTSWVKTDEITKEFYGCIKWVTVVNFKVKDTG